GLTHAISRQHAGQWMNENASHAQSIGDETCMLSRRSSEAAQCVFGDIMAALHGDLFDRIRHVADGDLDESLRDLLGSAPVAGCFMNGFGELRELCFHGIRVQASAAGW